MEDRCHGVSQGVVNIRKYLLVSVDAAGAGFVGGVCWALASVASMGGLSAVLAFEGAVIGGVPVMVAGQGGHPFGHEKTRHIGRVVDVGDSYSALERGKRVPGEGGFIISISLMSLAVLSICLS